MKTGRIFLSRDILGRISYDIKTASQEGQLLENKSCRLLVGFNRGLHCCVRKRSDGGAHGSLMFLSIVKEFLPGQKDTDTT